MSAQWIGLLANLGVLSIIISFWTYCLGWIDSWPRLARVAGALLAAGGAVVVMLVPFEIRPGLYFDLRSVPIVLAGFFGGPAIGVAAGVAAALFRATVGGLGAFSGVIGIGVFTLIGIAGHVALRGRPPGVGGIVAVAASTALASLVGYFFLPDGLWRTVIPEVAAPSLVLVFVATAISGLAIRNELGRREAARANHIYRAIIEALPDPLNAKDLDGRFFAANPATARLMQADSAAALIGRRDADFYPPDVAERFRADEIATLAAGAPRTIEQEVAFRGGERGWLATLKAPLRDASGALVGLLTHNRDITRRKTLEAEAAESRRRLDDALANMADGLVMYDREDRLVLCNEQYREIFPRTAHLRVPGALFADILRASIESGEQAGVAPYEEEAWIAETVASLHVPGEAYIETGDGRFLHTRVRATADGGSLSVISDVTVARLAERKLAELNVSLRELARLDGLTGLANRRAFDESLESEFRRSTRSRAPISLLLIDVDRFKRFNDAYGHPEGDRCLKAVAEALRRVLKRPTDLAARYGGEEFAAILPDTELDGAAGIAEAFREAVRALGLPHAGSEYGVVTVSIGVAAASPAEARDAPSALVAAADRALYAAKETGRDRVSVARGEGATDGGERRAGAA